MTEMVQHCFHPRLLLSPMDAEFCARMIKILHHLGTPGFSTASCYDKVIGDHLSAVILACSDSEIGNYGMGNVTVTLVDFDDSRWLQVASCDSSSQILTSGMAARSAIGVRCAAEL